LFTSLNFQANVSNKLLPGNPQETRKSTGFPGNPQGLQEIHKNPGNPQGFQEIHRGSRTSTGVPGNPQEFTRIQEIHKNPGNPQGFQEIHKDSRKSTRIHKNPGNPKETRLTGDLPPPDFTRSQQFLQAICRILTVLNLLLLCFSYSFTNPTHSH
jgi:hypothetical protein